jgi:hypothetical protein
MTDTRTAIIQPLTAPERTAAAKAEIRKLRRIRQKAEDKLLQAEHWRKRAERYKREIASLLVQAGMQL